MQQGLIYKDFIFTGKIKLTKNSIVIIIFKS